MNKYKALDFYMLRVPMFSTREYKDMFDGSNIPLEKKLYEKYLSSDYLKESLCVASSELYGALGRIKKIDGSKSAEQLASSLNKYYVRTSSRPTPFGLFSGITLGRFHDNTQIPIVQEKNV